MERAKLKMKQPKQKKQTPEKKNPRSEELAEKLTPKQKLFCDVYKTNGFNATQAALVAGYSEKCSHQIGYENIRKPYIKGYLDACMKETAEKLGINNDWILKKLKFGVDVAIPDIDENDGKKTAIEKMNRFDFHAGIKGIAEINKMLGNYEPEKKDIDIGEKTKPLVEKYEKEF